jgi:hypothetical protein
MFTLIFDVENDRITANHNQTVRRPTPSIQPQHNQTVVRPKPFGLITNHNQTVVGTPALILWPQHNQTLRTGK